MGGFDEILTLEERQQEVEMNLGLQRDLTRSMSRKIFDAKRDLEQIRGHIATVRGLIKNLKQDALVVLLTEYQTAQNILADNLHLETLKKTDIGIFERKLREATAVIPQFEVELARVERELSKFGKVLPFHEPH